MPLLNLVVMLIVIGVLSMAFQGLVERVVSLEDIVTHLEQRLAPICCPAAPTTETRLSDPVGSEGPVVDGLHATNRRISNVLDRFTALDKRLAV